MVATTSSADIELIGQDGTVLPLMFARPLARDGVTLEDRPVGFEEALAGGAADAPLSEWLEAKVIEDWFPGIGLAYDVAIGCDTFSSPGYVFPGGEATDVSLPAGHTSGSPIIAFADYGGDLYLAQQGDGTVNTARVLKSTGGTGPFNEVMALGAGEYIRDLLVADNGFGAQVLWVTSSGLTGGDGRMHQFTMAGVLTQTPVGTFGINGRNRIVKVFWEGDDGVGAWRLVTLSSQLGHVSYTRPGGNPMLPSGWVEGVKVGGGEGIQQMAAAKRHVYLISDENVYDLDEQGNSPALTQYTPQHRGNRGACFYMDGFVYRSLGVGLDRVDVSQGPLLQETPGICSPGWGTRAEHPFLSGYTTALSTYMGGLLCGTLSAPLSQSAIFWGIPRDKVGIETPNPLVWHGPFAASVPNVAVSRLHVTSTAATPSGIRLWVATWPTSQADPPALSWISLPSAGGAITDINSSGGHRFASGTGTGTWNRVCQLWGLADTVGDKGSVKEIYQHTVGSRGLGSPAGTKLTVSTRADPAPASTAWGTGIDILEGPTADITPVITSGHKLEARIDLVSPAGGSVPPKPAILDSVRTTYWRTAPDLNTWVVDVEYGPGVVDIQNTGWLNQGRDLTWYTDQLIGMCRTGRITMRDRQNRRLTVKLKQALPRQTTVVDTPYGAITRARVTIALLGAA